MSRQCNCSGACQPQAGGINRREFIGVLGAGSASALLAGPAWAQSVAGQLTADELERWKRDLFEPGPPRIYYSDVHTDARLHLGGIGTGNVELGADGQFSNWQLFNTLRDGHVPFYFAVKSGNTAKLLQTAGGPDWPRVERIEMKGEYPFAALRFIDKELPVEIELSAFSPFAPLDTRLSSMPLAVLLFRIHNPTSQSREVSLAAFIQNPTGYDAAGAVQGVRHPNFGGNINQCKAAGQWTVLAMSAVPGAEPVLDKPVAVFASRNLRGLKSPPSNYPPNLAVRILDDEPIQINEPANLGETVIWLEDAAMDISPGLLGAARDAVQSGATLLVAGRNMPLLEAYAQATGGKPLPPPSSRPDIMFEDFENGYGNWTVSGEAFGAKPATGTLPNQQKVSGFIGKGLVNTYLEGDDTTGRLVSKPFAIERDFISFLAGGGAHASTQIRLIVGGKIVRAVSGRNNELLLPAYWDVREFKSKTAHIEIVDDQKGPWGHINIDHIKFTDLPQDRQVLELLETLLPVRLSGVRHLNKPEDKSPNTIQFDGLELRQGAVQSAASNGLRLFVQPFGKGKVVVAAGPVLDPAESELDGARQQACAVVCEMVGANYRGPASRPPSAPGFGTLALAASGPNPSVQTAFDDWDEIWKTFSTRGRFEPIDQSKPNPPTSPGCTVNGAVAGTVELAAGQTIEAPFMLAWRYPNKYNRDGVWMGCHYATLWPDAESVVREAAADFQIIRNKTERFRDAFYDATLPYWLLDCLTSQASTIRHIGIVFRIANGDAYGWEGSNGCCQPTCTHVWGYEQTLARLFPDLEREMRRIDFIHQQNPDGGINNRTAVPSPQRPTGERPFTDGHASCILKAYREALNCPDDSWLRAYWPHVKMAAEYLINRDAASSGGRPSGTLNDDQWNTYDQALHGVTTFIGAYYLAALRAAEQWARRVGDPESAERFHGIFQKGQKRLVKLCWNGEYFQQHLPDYMNRRGEVGPGCMSDQLIGQWWAHQLGLGYLLPKDYVRSALRAIFKYNWVSDLTGWKHSPRAFAGDKDKGLIICTWPKGGRPATVMLYSDEVWTGIEYQVAAHMVYEGLIDEAFAIIKAARDRYDGIPRPPISRNPWNEIECGGHYARAMSSWSILLALSGYEYDGPAKSLSFAPRLNASNFKGFFCGPEGWGNLCQSRMNDVQQNAIKVAEGKFELSQLRLACQQTPQRVSASVNKLPISARFETTDSGVMIAFASAISLKTGDELAVSLS